MSATKVGVGAASALAIAGLVYSAHRTESNLREENNALRQQMEELNAHVQVLSNQLAQATADRAATNSQLGELMRLRGEVGVLRRQLAEAAKVHETSVQTALSSPASAADPNEQWRTMGIRKLYDAKTWLFAFTQYAADHGRQFPTNFNQVTSYIEPALRGGVNADNLARDPSEFAQSTNDFEIVYQGPIDAITIPSRTIVMREKEAWQAPSGGWSRTYGFADGHSEIHKTVDGNFTAWEEQHSPQGASQ